MWRSEYFNADSYIWRYIFSGFYLARFVALVVKEIYIDTLVPGYQIHAKYKIWTSFFIQLLIQPERDLNRTGCRSFS